MFWKTKPQSPITPEDEQWVISSFEWFANEFQTDLKQQIIHKPDDQFGGFEYQGSEADATKLLHQIAQLLSIENSKINTFFFNEFQPMEFTDEAIYSNYEEDAELVNGVYSKLVDGVYEIGVERSLLNQPAKLVATIAHELTHIKLLGENRLQENDEELTDLSACLFGFVIFMANSSLNKMSTWAGNSHHGWSISGGSGYLHYKVYAFLIAYWSKLRKEENPEWWTYLDKEIFKEIKKSSRYLNSKQT